MISNSKTFQYSIFSSWAGVLAVLAVYFFMKSLEFGSVGIAYLFVNLMIVVEMAEEFIVYRILPTIIGAIGTAITLVDASVVVFYQHSKMV